MTAEQIAECWKARDPALRPLVAQALPSMVSQSLWKLENLDLVHIVDKVVAVTDLGRGHVEGQDGPMVLMSNDVVVMPMTEQDWPQVERIYAAGIEAGHATFEATTPPWEAFDSSRLADHRFVAVHHDSTVLGWVACSLVSTRPAYAGVVEHSLHVAPSAQGKGIGGLLLNELINSTEAAGIWHPVDHLRRKYRQP